MNKFIYKGVVKENLDPKGLGRVRIEPEDWLISDVKYVTEYLDKFTESKDKWNGVSDPFMFSPFLPNHINIVPQVGEVVNIFYTDPDTLFIDGFYMPSSVTDRGFPDSNSAEHLLTQSRQGVAYKKGKDLIKENGEYVKKRYEGSIVKPEDFGISSRLNSDVIWRDNDVIIRAGKINEDVTKKQSEPIRDENPAIIQVSKFDYTTTKVKGDVEEVIEKKLSHIEVLIEYNIQSIEGINGEFQGDLFVYKLAKREGFTESIYFNQITLVGEDEKELLYTKQHFSSSLGELTSLLRQSIKQIMNVGLSGVKDLDFIIKHPSNVNHNDNTSIFPLYIRPTVSNYNSYSSNADYNNVVLDRMRIRSRRGYGLIFDNEFDDTPTKQISVQTYDIKKENKPNKNITVLSDKNFFISYGNNIPTDSVGIDFSKISNYHISQDEIVSNIEPNTYALVRGEKLQELLDVIYLYLISHVHNPAEPPVVKPSVKKELEEKFQDFKQNILSQKIRIN
jgi:hypothetical protein